MLHRFRSRFVALVYAVFVCAILCWTAAPVRGQNLAFNPGLANAYAGDPTFGHATSSGSYTGPLNNWSNNYTQGSGLVLSSPAAMAYDSKGNLFLVDSGNIRVVAAGNGAIPSVPSAGSSPQAGYVYPVAYSSTACSTKTDTYGDGCAATSAVVAATGVAIDANGNVYLSDNSASEIRVVYGGGSIPGLPANPVQGNIYALVGVAGSSGNSGDGGPALSAKISLPYSVALDSHGNVYFADRGNDAVRVLYLAAGSTVSGLSSPQVGNLYTIAGTLGKYCSSGACGDGGSATAAQFAFNLGQVGIDPSGNIYIADTNNYRVRAIYAGGTLPGISDPTPGNIYTVAGGGTSGLTAGMPATDILLQGPLGLAFDAAGSFYFSDEVNAIMYRVDPSGAISGVLGGAQLNSDQSAYVSCAAATDIFGDGCLANQVGMISPAGIAVDSAGNIYAGDTQVPVIHQAVVASSAVAFFVPLGASISQTFTVYNTGSTDLQLKDITLSSPFTQVGTGGSLDCGNSTLLAPGANCQIGITASPTQAGPISGTLQVSSNSKNATDGVNTVSLSGTISQATTGTALTASPSLPALASPGQSITFTATVRPQTGNAPVAPTGTVTFNNGATVLGTGTLDGSGVATFATSSLSAGGPYGVTASYSGDVNFIASTSPAVFVTVSSTPVPAVMLTASPANPTAGQTVTLTATVTPPSGQADPTGSITFLNGVNPLGAAVSLSGGSATFTTSSLPAGMNTLFATYSGNLAANSSAPVNMIVGANAQLQFSPGMISRIAGTYSGSYPASGDGGLATTSPVYRPSGMTYDPAGNLYFVDALNNVVRVVASGKGTVPGVSSPQAGNIYTVAGVHSSGIGSATICSTLNPNLSTNPNCGDGGPANQAWLDVSSGNPGYAGGLAIDPTGNLYIADGGSHAIRKVTPDGKINTVIGTLRSTGAASGNDVPASQAILSAALPAIIFDNAGNLYFIDGSAVRRVDAQTQIITTIAGSLTATGYSGDGGPAMAARFTAPTALAFDPQGNLYISDTANEVVREVNIQTGIITTVAGYNYDTTAAGCQYGANCHVGDGGPATQAQLYTPIGIAFDGAGDLYIADNGNFAIREVNAQTGIINLIAGQEGTLCGSLGTPCTDGVLATNATSEGPIFLAFDPAGNLTFGDVQSAIRQISAATDAVNFGTPNLGTISGQALTVTNTGTQPLTITGITASDGFTQAASGGTDCAASTTLTPAQQCTIDVQFFPTDAKAYTGTVTVASNSANATAGVNTITVTGTGTANSGTTSQTLTFNAPPAPYDQGMEIALGGSASSGLPVQYLVSGPGLILNNGQPNASLKITGAGAISVIAYQFGNSTYAAATPVTVNFTAVQPVLTITPQNETLTQGQSLPAYTTYNASGFIPGDSTTSLTGQPTISVVDSTGATVPVGSTPEAGTYTLAITQGSLVAPSYYKLSFATGTLTVSGTNQQTIVFQPLPSNLTYGAAAITLNAVANDTTTGKADGLPVTFSTTSTADTITGNVLTIGGAGPVLVTAMQAGNAFYGSATATQSAVVAKASLTVTAAPQTLAQGVGLPTLNSPIDYTFGSFVNGETSAVLTGAPALTIVDASGNVLAPGATPPVGTYTIQIAQGSLSSSNYAFNFVNGAFTVVQGKSQTITFPAIPNVAYGASAIALNASTDSGLGIVYSVVSGPATVAGNILSVHGVGTVTVMASQPGDATHAPASATQSFKVEPALLTVIASDVTRVNNVPNPPLTGYTFTGFVNGDTASVVSGTPAISTTGLPGSPVGTYPITIGQPAQNSVLYPGLLAANYTFAYVDGTLTITSGGPTPDYSLTAAPALLEIAQGQIGQTIITLTPTNYYQGTVKLSCGNLPANMTCVFSPSALIADGTGNTVTGTLTVNTNSANSIVAQASPMSRPGSQLSPAAVFYLPGEFAALVVAFYRRKRVKGSRTIQLLVLLILLTGTFALTACGGSSSVSSTQYAAPGSYAVSLSAADSAGGASHSIDLTVDVQ